MKRLGPSLGLALTSASLLSTEVVITRIFSALVWYHFAFFAISVALFGLGVAALGVHLLEPRLRREHTARWSTLGACSLSISIVVVDLLLLLKLPSLLFQGGPFEHSTWGLVLLFALAALPFLCGGFVIALQMTRGATEVHRLYFWDLLGAAAACALVVPLVASLGAPVALLSTAVLAALAAVTFSQSSRQRWVSLAVLFSALATTFAAQRQQWLQLRVAKGIDLDALDAEYTSWNDFSVVTVLGTSNFRGWGLSPIYQGSIPEQKTLLIDLNAMTPLVRFDGSFTPVQALRYDLSAAVFWVRKAPQKVCVIGAGGGKDVLAALAAGAKEVQAVEINPLIVEEVMRGRYRDYVGGLYDRTDVKVAIEDGRSFIERSSERYDVLQLSMVDTSAATPAGAYALTENSLYTVEAFQSFLGALKPHGLLTVSSASLPDLAVGARLVSVASSALRSQGVNPADSIAVLRTRWVGHELPLYNLLIAKSGFVKKDLDALKRAAHFVGFSVVYLPGVEAQPKSTEEQWIVDLLQENLASAEALERLPLDISPATDNRPFFFYQNRLRDAGRQLTSNSSHLFGNGLAVLLKVLLVTTLLVALFLLVPLFVHRKSWQAGEGWVGYDLLYVCCLGLGFMCVEIALLQLLSAFLGHPTATLSIVLLVLLLCGSWGSRLLAAPGPRAGQRLRWALGGVLLCTTLLILFAPGWLQAAWGSSVWTKRTVAIALLAPLGFVLGAPYPAGLRYVAVRAPRRIPWLWSLNSATSVLGAVLATLSSLSFGIHTTLGVGALLYAGALVVSFRVTREYPSRLASA